VELSNYDSGFHTFNSDATIAIWNSKSNTLIYITPQYAGSWSFNGQNQTAVLKSPKLSPSREGDGITSDHQVKFPGPLRAVKNGIWKRCYTCRCCSI